MGGCRGRLNPTAAPPPPPQASNEAGSGAVTLLTAACSRSARSQKRQPTWFPHCPTAKGRERHGSGTGRGRRGGALAATAPYPAPPPTGPWRAAATTSAFELGARKPRPPNGRGGRAFLTARPPSPRFPPAVERPIRWHTCGRSPPTRREWNIPLGSGGEEGV